MNTRNWDAHFMAIAELNAGMATCIRRGVGAVAVRHRHALVSGFNGNLPGAVHCVDGGCARCADQSIPSGANLDACVCVHAEANLVTQAARQGTRLDGCTVYLTVQPCLTCYKLLASAGVVEIIYAETYASRLPAIEGMEKRLWVR